MKYTLLITRYDPDTAKKTEIYGSIQLEKPAQVTEHEIAGALFAIEFAANNNEFYPMRVHINEA